MAFNLSKTSSKQPITKSYEAQLRDSNKDHGLHSTSNPGSIDYQLKENNHKNADNLVPFEKQMEEARAKKINSGNTEKSLNDNEKLFLERRVDKTNKTTVKPLDLLAEAYDQVRNDAFGKKNKSGKAFQNKNPGEQMIGEKTKIVGNSQNSQLANSKDRFDGLSETQPIHTDHNKNADAMKKDDNIKPISSAKDTMKEADAMLFHLFAKAASEKRDLTSQEKQMVVDINSSKAKILATL